MSDYRVIEVKQSVLASNEQKADELRSKMKEKGTLLINLMSSPGSGKTTTLRRTIKALKGKLDIAVMEADIDSDVDAAAISEVGAQTIQLVRTRARRSCRRRCRRNLFGKCGQPCVSCGI